MARSKDSKQAIIKELTEKIRVSKSLLFVSLKGLKVKQTEELRRNLSKEAIECMMAKKTLIRRSLENRGITQVDPKQYEGEIALVCGYNDEVAPARIVAAFSKANDALKILGGIMMQQDGQPLIMDMAGVKRLANLPSQQELRAKLVGSLVSPLRGVVSVLQGNLRALVYVLNAVKDAKAS